jgi:hypothetical protein
MLAVAAEPHNKEVLELVELAEAGLVLLVVVGETTELQTLVAEEAAVMVDSHTLVVTADLELL